MATPPTHFVADDVTDEVWEDENVTSGTLTSLPDFGILNATSLSLSPRIENPKILDAAIYLLPGTVQETSFGNDPTQGAVAFIRRKFTTTAIDVAELRERLALTWSELAELFGVSRRAVHNWANGTTMNTRNQHRLSELFGMLILPGRSPEAARDVLMQSREGRPSRYRELVRSRDTASGGNGPSAAALFAGADLDIAHVPVEVLEVSEDSRHTIPIADQ